MKTAEAKIRFKKYLVNECPNCGAKVGALCHSGGAWVHIERFELLWGYFPTWCGRKFETKEARQNHFDNCEKCQAVIQRHDH